jgi:phosphorylcholine metabolism protein LicD
MSYGTQERIDAERVIKSAYNRYKATQDPKDKETVQQLLQNAAKSNLFTPRQLQNLVEKLRMSPEDTKHQLFKRLPADDQISIAQYMTKEQLKEFWQFFNESTMEQLRNPKNSAAQKLRERLLELKNENQR